MISDRAIETALAENTLTPAQVARLRAIAVESSPVPEPIDDENLRFVTGFADIFVTIGIVLFLGALAFLMGAGAGSTPMFAGVAICAWLLAEFFTFKRRMALPSIVLLVVFAGAIFVLTLQIATSLLPVGWQFRDASSIDEIFESASGTVIAALATAGFCTLHYLRFRVPITVAAGAAALCILAVAGIAIVLRLASPFSGTIFNATLFICGLAVFALAMRFDMSDPQRLTRRTDIAFWLHLLAAPLLVHPLIRGFLHGLDARLTPVNAAGVLAVFAALGILAVIVDRRAILVSALTYAGIAAATLIHTFGITRFDYELPTVLLALGAFILLLSAGWQPLRRAMLRRLPQPLATRLPHPLATSGT